MEKPDPKDSMCTGKEIPCVFPGCQDLSCGEFCEKDRHCGKSYFVLTKKCCECDICKDYNSGPEPPTEPPTSEETTISNSVPEICTMKPRLSKKCKCLKGKHKKACKNHFKEFYFDTEMEKCKKIKKGECLLNENQFKTKEECEQTCQLSVDSEEISKE